MKNHKEEYVAVRDGAITYFREEDRSDDLITLYGKSQDANKRVQVVAFIKQRDEQKKVFLDSMEEFDKLKEKIEAKSKKTGEKENEEGEIKPQTVDGDDSQDENNSNKKEDSASEIKELEKKAKVVEEVGKLLMENMSELNQFKNSLMKGSVDLRHYYGG